MNDQKLAIEHIRNHVEYPATSQDLVTACSGLSEFSEEDKEWFRTHLPAGTYATPEDVLTALGWT